MPYPWLWPWIVLVFALGAVIGSFLNVVAFRVPYEKSVLWPGSHCFRCFQPIAWRDNLPLISYWVLRGRCRRCHAPFSIRYFLVELFTGLAFAGLFYAEIVRNRLDLPLLKSQYWLFAMRFGNIPFGAWMVFVCHATLLSFLIAASLCDLEHYEIPLNLTVTGTVVGLILSTLFPWPYPAEHPEPPPRVQVVIAGLPNLNPIQAGMHPWPVWDPLPDWLPPGSWQLGLVTGLVGALVGMLLLRGVRFLFGLGRGLEGMGVGDADLMMMAGAFLGWQAVVMAFFLAVFPALVFGVTLALMKGDQVLPFGPSLAGGVVLTLLLWPELARSFRMLFFNSSAVFVLAGLGAVLLFVAAFLLRLLRGRPAED
jgi:leader peptidase (prepilin peptidase) / N-methyltransferase